jgi:hypothetical protein
VKVLPTVAAKVLPTFAAQVLPIADVEVLPTLAARSATHSRYHSATHQLKVDLWEQCLVTGVAPQVHDLVDRPRAMDL